MSKRYRRCRTMTHPGLRMQLTLYYSVVSFILLLIFGAVFYISLQQLLASSFDSTLQMRAQQIVEGVEVHGGKLAVNDIMDELPELNATAAIIDTNHEAENTVRDHDGSRVGQPPVNDKRLIVRVLDLQGHVVFHTSTFQVPHLPMESLRNPQHGKPWYGTVFDAGNQPIRLYSTMIVQGQHRMGVIQVGQSLTGLYTSLQFILLGILVATPVILALCAWGSYWLAGRAFLPIHRLTRTAREISVKNLHQRVPLPLAKDEVYDLASIFNQMIGRLETAFAQQHRFVADASHELRTPVSVIRSLTEVTLAQPASKDEYISVLKEVNAESERLGRLINDLLALARADEGQLVLDHEPVQVNLLLLDVAESMTPLAEERSITLLVGEVQPATVMGDAARLIQVLMSLVDNALAYTNAGGIVTLSCTTCSKHVHLVVQDTGIGIAADDIKHIFERFYRADPARSKAVGGCGLGLSIVDWAVKAHHGTVTVESQPGTGSTFTVTLPTISARVPTALVPR